jgi:hypothetical protein
MCVRVHACADRVICEPLLANADDPAASRREWTPEEDAALAEAIRLHGDGDWRSVARLVPGRDRKMCLLRWRLASAPGVLKGFWTAEEDEKLRGLVATHGAHKCAACAEHHNAMRCDALRCDAMRCDAMCGPRSFVCPRGPRIPCSRALVACSSP